MRILLVNPDAKVNRDLPNISLAYAATHFKAPIIDLNTKREPYKRFLEKKADVLGISLQSRTQKEAQKIASFYKQKFTKAEIKSVKTIVDIQCCYPFLDWERKLEFKEPFGDELPFPNYELFDSFPIFLKHWQDCSWAFPILTSLGCPFQCVYCSARNRKWHDRTPENVFEELKQAKDKWGIKSFQIIDDCFSVNKKRAIKVCKLLKKLKLPWFCTNGLRADLFDQEFAVALKESGCNQISFGVESLNDKVLVNVKKGETSFQIKEAVKIAKKYFSDINLYFIIGLKGSSFKKDLINLRWIAENKVKGHFSYFVAKEKGNNLVFYGENAKPTSSAYSKDDQKKIYLMSGYMRGEVNKKRLFKNIFLAFTYILFFDPLYFFKHLYNFMYLVRIKIQ